MGETSEIPPSYVDQSQKPDQDGDIDVSGPTLIEAFEDIETRFFMNLPEEEIQVPERLFFQIEQAWWFYEDFLADKYRHLQHYKKLDGFSTELFSKSNILRPYTDKLEEWLAAFKEYRSKIPVYGVILLNPTMEHVLMITGYHSKSWGFPKGKVNQNETGIQCALREGYEEVGYTIPPNAIREEDSLEYTSKAGKYTKLYIVCDVPLDFPFMPHVRKEIGTIQWKRISKLPNNNSDSKYWSVHQFTDILKAWIRKRKRKNNGRKSRGRKEHHQSPIPSELDPWNTGYIANEAYDASMLGRRNSASPQQSVMNVYESSVPSGDAYGPRAIKILDADAVMRAVDQYLVL